jgi:eukaryotic-like serine/threonine-protein kinase
MSELSAEQRARVDALMDELLDLPEAGRAEWLSAKPIDDPAVRTEAESLLEAACAAQGFLAGPARPAVQPLSASIPSGTLLGVWRVGRRIGRGGMGEVYEATRSQGGFEQRVALKVLQLDAASQIERFVAERQILARLEHPGIARLYDGGLTDDGRPYMAMEFVEGRPITTHCEQTQATLQQRLQLFTDVCEAVAYAHRNLVIHRDLKPSNILVSTQGQVKLLDFGIAKLIDAERAQLTVTAAVPMTPVCASPEQLVGGPITTATDVYALGLLLFELLTGSHPWVGPDVPMLQAMRTLMQRTAPLASRAAASAAHAPVPERLIRGDLDAIVAKSLREEPTHRYPTVEALKLDVARMLRGEPVEAREGARLYVFGRLLRRYRWAAVAVAGAFLCLSAGLAVAFWQARQASIERDIALRDAAREEAVRYNLTRMFRSTIADQSQGAQPATAKSMIDSSALRVLREYRDRPQLAGQLVLTLADLYGALEDVAGAGSLLEGFVSQAGPDADPVALADARQKLANIELLRGHTERAAVLLDQAQDFWSRAPQQYAEEHLEGLGTRARLQRTRGDLDGAIATSREAIAARTALSGRDHRETASLYNSLAITLTQASRLDEALAAYRETMRIYRAGGLGDGLDAQVVLGNMGTLEFRTGHLHESETLLKTAVEHERALAGDSAAVAAAMGQYGKVLAVENRIPEALTVLREGVSVAERYAGAKSPVTVQNEVFFGDTQAASGDEAGAHATLQAAYEAALAQYGPSHALTLRTQLSLAQLAVTTGHPEEARSQLSAVVAGLRALGPQAVSYLAQALKTQGELSLADGHAQSAVESLTEAVRLQNQVHDRTWESAVTRERLGEAALTLGRADALGQLQGAEHDLAAQLGPNHPQTLRAEQVLAQVTR